MGLSVEEFRVRVGAHLPSPTLKKHESCRFVVIHYSGLISMFLRHGAWNDRRMYDGKQRSQKFWMRRH